MRPGQTESCNVCLPRAWGRSCWQLTWAPSVRAPLYISTKVLKYLGTHRLNHCTWPRAHWCLLEVRPVCVSSTERRWKTHLFILINVNEFYSLSKCYQDPNEMSSAFFFPFQGEGSEGGVKWMLKTDGFDLKRKQTTSEKKKAFIILETLAFLQIHSWINH